MGCGHGRAQGDELIDALSGHKSAKAERIGVTCAIAEGVVRAAAGAKSTDTAVDQCVLVLGPIDLRALDRLVVSPAADLGVGIHGMAAGINAHLPEHGFGKKWNSGNRGEQSKIRSFAVLHWRFLRAVIISFFKPDIETTQYVNRRKMNELQSYRCSKGVESCIFPKGIGRLPAPAALLGGERIAI